MEDEHLSAPKLRADGGEFHRQAARYDHVLAAGGAIDIYTIRCLKACFATQRVPNLWSWMSVNC